MKTRLVFGVIVLFVAGMFTQTSTAQLVFESRVSTMFDDNILNNYQSIADKISTLTLNAGYRFGGNQWTADVSYSGALNYYQSVVERTNQFHALEGSFSHTFGEEDDNVLNVGLSYGQGFFRGSYAFYEHSQTLATVHAKQFLSDVIISNLRYTFQWVRFSQLTDFSYSEHALSGSLSFALPTQSTVIVQSDIGAKFYSSQVAGTTEGMRKGGMSFVPSVVQWVPLVRIGQSIVDGTGLSLTTKYQWNLLKQNRYLTSSYGAISDDELFDDHYGHEGLHMSLMLTQMVSESMLVRVTGSIQNKVYTSLGAYDLAGTLLSSQREDQRTSLSLLFQKTFDSGIAFKIAADIIRNRSNDAFYDYNNNAIAFELSLPL
jgi:hypothetical protein